MMGGVCVPTPVFFVDVVESDDASLVEDDDAVAVE